MLKIFLSSSGERGGRVGIRLEEWLEEVFGKDALKIWSYHRSPSGSSWAEEVLRALEDCSLGIVCVTREALGSRWVLFEAGALTMARADRPLRVVPLLLDVKQAELSTPLSLFIVTELTQGSFLRLLESINSCLDAPLPRRVLSTKLGETWDALHGDIQDILQAGFWNRFMAANGGRALHAILSPKGPGHTHVYRRRQKAKGHTTKISYNEADSIQQLRRYLPHADFSLRHADLPRPQKGGLLIVGSPHANRICGAVLDRWTGNDFPYQFMTRLDVGPACLQAMDDIGVPPEVSARLLALRTVHEDELPDLLDGFDDKDECTDALKRTADLDRKYIRCVASGARCFPTYEPRTRAVEKDYGLVARLTSPSRRQAALVLAGNTGFGTQGAVLAVMTETILATLDDTAGSADLAALVSTEVAGGGRPGGRAQQPRVEQVCRLEGGRWTCAEETAA